MTLVRKKLKNNDGASLALALLVFLMAALIGVSILSASMSGNGSVQSLEKHDRDMYLVESAADILSDNICGKSYTYVESDKPDNRVDLSKLAETMAYVVSNTGKECSVSDFTITINGDSDSEVTCDLTMNTSYQINGVIKHGSQQATIFIDAADYENSGYEDHFIIWSGNSEVVLG